MSKKVCIVGVCGTIGESLLKFHKKKKHRITGYDINEEKLSNLSRKFEKNKLIKIGFLDIKNKQEVDRHLNDFEVVYHVAALKHVNICEYAPNEAISTNVEGTNNLVNASLKNNIKKFIYASTDKAVNPTNVMGTSKLLAEKIVIAANIHSKKCKFSTVRFGNVLGSSGSIIEILKSQFLKNMDLTITDEKMTRYVMTISDATNLLAKCSNIMVGGELFIIKMKALKIIDLINVFNKICSKRYKSKRKKIKKIGSFPGEKVYEELMNDEELRRSYDYKNYIVILPALEDFFDKKLYKKYSNLKKLDKLYISKNSKLSDGKEITKILSQINI